MSKCPSCFTLLNPDSCLLYCENDSHEPTAFWINNPAPGTYWTPSDFEKSCPNCNLSNANELCPKCNNDIPTGWRNVIATYVAIAGARTTGKSVYIGVLIKELQKYFRDNVKQTVSPGNSATSTKYEDEYENALYVQRNLIDATKRGLLQESMVWDLGVINGFPHALVIRDVAGEALESGDVNDENLGHLANADTVLFMFDPMRVESVRAKLFGQIPTGAVGGDPEKVFQFVLNIIRNAEPPVHPNIGIVLSKFDVMQKFKNSDTSSLKRMFSDPRAAFSRDPKPGTYLYSSPNGAVQPGNDADLRLLSEEIRTVLLKHDANGIINPLESSNSSNFQHRFFAVSAMGDIPDGGSVSPRGITPFRVLDPIMWAFNTTWPDLTQVTISQNQNSQQQDTKHKLFGRK
ncbi:putative ESX-1 scaffolding and assembly protein SaeC [Actinomycetota bacterium]|nr:putative ESX-1 scaffolding and assembly protein SaeC [Actinomycetota bacterium]